jgi:hypothetical protein
LTGSVWLLRTASRRSPVQALALVALGCQGSGDVEAEFDHRTLAPRSIALETFLEDTLFGTPWRLHVLNDSVLLVTDNQPPYLHSVHIPRRQILSSFGRSGRGPGEFVSVPQVTPFIAPTDSFVTWARDLSRFSFSTVQPRLGTRDSTVVAERHGATTNPLVLRDSVLVMQSTTDSTGFVVYSLRGNDVRYGGVPMQFSKSDSLTPLAASSLPGDLVACASPDGRTIVRASRVAGKVELVDVATFAVRNVEVPYSFEPYYEWDPEYSGYVVQQIAKQRRAYIDCATTPEGFLLLFSGRLRGAFPDQYDRLLGQYLHAFTWDGTLSYVGRFDVPIWAFALALNGRDVFALRWEPGPALMFGSLPPISP